MQLHASPEIASLLEKALGICVRQGQFFVGVDHLFAALLDTPDALPEKVREQHLNALFAAAREMNRTPWKGSAPTTTGEIFHTPRCIAVTQQAGKFADMNGRRPANAGDLLLALLSDGCSSPSRALDRLHQNRGAIIETLRAELSRQMPPAHRSRTASAPAAAPSAEPVPLPAFEPSGTPREPAAAVNGPPLTRDLSDAAWQGELEPAVGRDNEIFEIMQILTRKTKNNVMLVGDAGVGKTQVVEGLALSLARGLDIPGAPPLHFLALNLAALMAGTQYRGVFEEKVLALLEQLKGSENTVLFIDEVHLIMGAGSTEGGSMDLANLLKPALARGEIRCIGATTLQEYRKFVEKDPAIERRFQMVRLEELSEAASLQVLERLRPSFEKHHGIRISGRALQAAVALTQRYLPQRRLPDKAIDVLDQACARFRMKLMMTKTNPNMLSETLMPTAENKVTPHDIRKVVSQVSGIPVEEITAAERFHLTDLDRQLRSQLIGQDEAVAKVVSVVRKARVGLADPNRPEAVLLFLGPSGVGKTQLAKLLAQQLFGSRNHLITFDMSEYIEEHSVAKLIGAPPGYVGSEEEGQLTSAVRNTPFSIVLFDEVEKAHPRIFDIFLPMFEEGRLKDSHGRMISFKNCIIILTSNIGAQCLYRSETGGSGNDLMEELRQHFRPELINRIDEIVPFYPLLAEDIRTILRLEINRVRERLKDRRIGIRMYQRAYEHLAQQGYNADYGARELRRAVDRLITTPISQMLLSGAFQPGDMIDVLMDDRELIFRKGQPHHENREGPA